MSPVRACRKCHILTSDKVCPVCHESNLSSSYSGLVIIIDPDNSEVAKILNIKNPGTYALEVR
ncbi:MAG: transcription elongation factor subunit Spt4 [Candidatus Asgardarchaeia archaeon]